MKRQYSESSKFQLLFLFSWKSVKPANKQFRFRRGLRRMGRGYGSPVAVSDKEISTAPIFSASPHTLQPRNPGSLEYFGGLNVLALMNQLAHKSDHMKYKNDYSNGYVQELS